jgi:hypothetical protein
MCDIPLDLQRKFERRWAARFARPERSAAIQKQRLKGQSEPLDALLIAKRKARRVEPAEPSR